MTFRTASVSWNTREERFRRIMPTAPGSLRYLLYGMISFLVLSVISGSIIQQFPTSDSRGAIGLPLIMLSFGSLFYALHHGDQHTWRVLQRDAAGVPVFYSFGRSNTMLLGHSKGWVGYGCLHETEQGGFFIDSKYQLRIDHLGTDVQFGLVLIENRKQQVACVSSSDGNQLFLWQPRRDIRELLAPLLSSDSQRPSNVSGLPAVEEWMVLLPTRFTLKGLWPTLLFVGLIQCGMVYLAKLSEMTQIAWLPVGICVAPMMFFLFEGAGRQRSISFGQYLER